MKRVLFIIVFLFSVLLVITNNPRDLFGSLKQTVDSQKAHFVSIDGTASWSEATDINTPCSISTANSNAGAGDTVFIRGGTYDKGEYICPVNSGTSDSARITYCNYNDENVTITNADYAILLDGKSYISVNGLNFYSMGYFLYIQNNANHNIIGYCTFDQDRSHDNWCGSGIFYSSQYNRIHHCTFSRWGNYVASEDRHRGSLLDIGDEYSETDETYYNLIEDNTFYYGGHHTLGIGSRYNVFRNNYFHNEGWEADSEGFRCSMTAGKTAGRNLFEGNRYAFGGKHCGVDLRSEKNIFRFNAFYNNGLGGIQCISLSGYTPAHYNHIYNNVFYNNGHDSDYSGFSGGTYFCDWGAGDPTGNILKNNIFYLNAGGIMTFDGVTDHQVVSNNWNQTGDPLFIYDGSQLTPFGDKPDFRLREGSPCIDSGIPLTKIINSSGSGTTFRVEDAGYFTDGFKIIQGDSIQLYGTTQKAVIINIDYDINEITVDREINWYYNQKFSLPYCGNNPDLGAYEFIDTGTGMEEEPVLPAEYNLSQNYPNPFNPATEIKFTLVKNSIVKITVYNVLGEEIKTLVNDNYPAGIHKIMWNGTNEFGKKVSSGVYIYKMNIDDKYNYSKKMVFLK